MVKCTKGQIRRLKTAGKKVKGKKRQFLVDTLGLLLHAIVHPADIQDRDTGRSDTPTAAVIEGCVILLSRGNAIWMR